MMHKRTTLAAIFNVGPVFRSTAHRRDEPNRPRAVLPRRSRRAERSIVLRFRAPRLSTLLRNALDHFPWEAHSPKTLSDGS
jgi:hypothetical protein